ncbi:MAG: Rrf2 family transcriptional regulator [Burkholderiales bacterium]|nr:Rrf2 family transcriptional regulator [Burkholderiales bacterium]MBH2017510.1 Rrf2 family transcriptional regulator [Burkholderiales bacterium]
MQLTHFTDLGLRVLMYLTQSQVLPSPPPQPPVTIGEIAQRFDVSRHHLVKVVQHLSQRGWVHATRGKGGGLSLGRAPGEIRLGELIRDLEGSRSLVDCNAPPCGLQGHCQLKGILDQALQALHDKLDEFTLQDAVASPTRETLIQLIRR